MMCLIAKDSPSTSIARLAGLGLWSVLWQSREAQRAFVEVCACQQRPRQYTHTGKHKSPHVGCRLKNANTTAHVRTHRATGCGS
jgi:hypothetical protein